MTEAKRLWWIGFAFATIAGVVSSAKLYCIAVGPSLLAVGYWVLSILSSIDTLRE